MTAVILRSALVGIASVVGAIVFGMPLGVIAAMAYQRTQGSGSGEVGWDLVTFAHNYPTLSILLPVVVFMIGVYIGYRHFSRSLARNQNPV
jgi:hypothetical protein